MPMRFPFRFDPGYRRLARLFGVTPERAWVDLGDEELEARYGPWRLRTPTRNIAAAEVTGPYAFFKTAGPARLGITDRGLLAEGRPADVVVFDAKTVGPSPLKRVYDLPAGADRLVSEASGIDAVIVNGKLIRRDGKDAVATNEKLPGRLLRHGRAA